MTETHFLRLLVLLSIAFGQGIVANIFGHGSDTFPGKYELSNGPFNDWHYVEITSKSGNDYTWTNRAGVSWTLTFQKKIDDTHLSFSVGTDCPYYRQGYTEGLLFTKTKRGVQIQGPGKELYAKRVGVNCDCNYHPGGCKIVIAAPANNKCKCIYQGFWTCTGLAKACNKWQRMCRDPDTSKDSCVYGGGDCGGY